MNALTHVAFETTMGAFYVFPDMTHEHFEVLLSQLNSVPERIVVPNVSGATLVLPFRILQRVHVVFSDEGGEDVGADAVHHPSCPSAWTRKVWEATP